MATITFIICCFTGHIFDKLIEQFKQIKAGIAQINRSKLANTLDVYINYRFICANI